MRNFRRAAAIGGVVTASVLGTAGPAAADCDLAELGRSGIVKEGTTVLVGGLYYLCHNDGWLG